MKNQATPRALRVLHLEDSPDDAALLRRKLELEGVKCDILVVSDKDSFEAALRREPFDVIISDYNLPGYDGVSALKQAQVLQPDVPVILVSGTVGEEQAVHCLHIGATDYLLKDHLERLASAVLRAIAEAETRLTRKRAETALADSERRKAAILNSVLDCIITMDAAGVVIEFNTAAERTFGYTKAEAIGRLLADLIIPPAYRAAYQAGLAHYLATGEGPMLDKCFEITALRSDGSELPVELTVTAIHTEKAPIFTGVLRDITDRKKAETALRNERDRAQEYLAALREVEERTQSVLQNANVGVWDMDYVTGELRWSGTIAAQYGLRPGEFGGTFDAFIELIHPDDRIAVLETILKATGGGDDFSVTHRTIWPDGTLRWLSGAGRILLDERGVPVRGVAISLDVTERHTLEQQFQQAQKMEAIGQLAGGVAHDFNNLLTVILGFCELLLEDFNADDPRQHDIVEIQKAGTRAAGLTRQLLAFSRKQIIEPTQLDLNVIVTDMQPMLRRLIREDVKVLLALEPTLSRVTADRGGVEQIIMNLAVNARDAMPKGGTLTIATANVELDEQYAKTHVAVTPGPHVMLTLSDTGTGMSPEVQARLFEPFFTTKEPGQGTGLGMATVYGIVSRSGGSVAVDSEVGSGTSFQLFFPSAGEVGTTVDAPALRAPVEAASQTILLVEDEEGLRELTKRLLLRQGYSVLVAVDADEAIRLFDANPSIDLVLTDVVMPGTSGPKLVAQLLVRRPGLPVIYMSGYTDDAIVEHGVLNPGIALVNKPFTSETLGQKIRDVLQRRAPSDDESSEVLVQ